MLRFGQPETRTRRPAPHDTHPSRSGNRSRVPFRSSVGPAQRTSAPPFALHRGHRSCVVRHRAVEWRRERPVRRGHYGHEILSRQDEVAARRRDARRRKAADGRDARSAVSSRPLARSAKWSPADRSAWRWWAHPMSTACAAPVPAPTCRSTGSRGMGRTRSRLRDVACRRIGRFRRPYGRPRCGRVRARDRGGAR